MSIIKIGSVELTEMEAERLYEEEKYIVTYSKIYKLEYSDAQKMVYGREIYNQRGLAKRGRYHTLTAAEVNHLLGFSLLMEIAK